MDKYISILAAFLTVFLGCHAPEDVNENAWTNESTEENTMALVPVGPAPGGPFATILCPDDGNPATAEDIRRPVAALLRNDELQGADIVDLQNDKVDRVGDTMTGLLTITPSGATSALIAYAGVGAGNAAIQAAGDASFPAIVATGGANGSGIVAFGGGNGRGIEATGAGTAPGVQATGGSAGNGGTFAAGGGNAHGISAQGSGTYSGCIAVGGSSGPGVIASSGTATTSTAPTEAIRASGYLRMFGADPNSNIDPGANNALHGANIPKAWVTLDNTYAILDGYNIASITHVVGSIYAVAFVRPMANANYGVKIHVHGAPGYSGAHNGTKTTTGFQFVLFKTDTLALGFGTATEAHIEIMGRQ